MLDIKPSKKNLPVYLLVDKSGSMDGASIQAVNRAVGEILVELGRANLENPHGDVQVEVITFGSGARTALPLTAPAGATWSAVNADDGSTDMGAAIRHLKASMATLSKRTATPILVLLTDGEATDDFDSAMDDFERNGWGVPSRTVRVAIAVQGANTAPLLRFTHDQNMIKEAHDAVTIVKLIKWATVTLSKTVSSASVTGGGAGASMAMVLPPPPGVGDESADVF